MQCSQYLGDRHQRSLRRPDFQLDARIFRTNLLDAGYNELSIEAHHALEILQLPPIHSYPFDRMLFAQAISEGIVLLPHDDIVRKYDSAPMQYVYTLRLTRAGSSSPSPGQVLTVLAGVDRNVPAKLRHRQKRTNRHRRDSAHTMRPVSMRPPVVKMKSPTFRLVLRR
ncbi:PIN domain-containing protein [Caballeronia novacaledonica]|uniref:PIN domain-containing protein n=1 Tax=Caballeronia novacaledonica TaxID=1544861 RepID=UPI0038572536